MYRVCPFSCSGRRPPDPQCNGPCKQGGGTIVKDADAQEQLLPCIAGLLENPEKIKELETNIAKLAKKDAAATIAAECLKLAYRR